MYKIYYKNKLIYDPRSDDEQLYNIKIKERVNQAAELTFSKPVTNPVELRELDGELVVLSGKEEIFRGKVTKISKGRDLSDRVTARCTLSYLNNAEVKAFDTLKGGLTGFTPSDFFRWLIETHNEQCSPSFSIGVNEADLLWNGNVFVRSSDSNMSVSECIKSRLLESLGGYVKTRYEKGNYIIDYFSDFKKVSTQAVEFGENFLSFSDDTDTKDLYTACYAYGEEDEDEIVDITSLPDMRYGNYNKIDDYIVNIAAAQRYGIRMTTYSNTELTTPEGVLDAAMRHIDGMCAPVKTLKVSAFDLSQIQDVEPIRLADYVQCKAEPYGFNAFMAVTEMNLDISRPESTSYTLGRPPEKLTGTTLRTLPAMMNTVDQIIVQVPSISQDAKAAAQAAQRAETAADGKSRNYITQEDPTGSEAVKPGDTWYNPITRQTYIYEEI